MDMFDFGQILELMKIDPGHGFLQSALLFMIWLSSRSLKKEMSELGKLISDMKMNHESRFVTIEGRISALEKPKGVGNEGRRDSGP